MHRVVFPEYKAIGRLLFLQRMETEESVNFVLGNPRLWSALFAAVLVGPHISLQQNRQTDPGNMYIILSQRYECRNWETEHYNSVLEITVSFLVIHKWEPDIYI